MFFFSLFPHSFRLISINILLILTAAIECETSKWQTSLRFAFLLNLSIHVLTAASTPKPIAWTWIAQMKNVFPFFSFDSKKKRQRKIKEKQSSFDFFLVRHAITRTQSILLIWDIFYFVFSSSSSIQFYVNSLYQSFCIAYMAQGW